MVTGMVGSDEEEDDEEGEGEKKKKEEEMKKKKDKPKDSEDDEEDPKKTFAEKYVGPPGTVVTIQSIPQAQFGFLPMEPQPGPSLCIRNTGDPNNPDVSGLNTCVNHHLCDIYWCSVSGFVVDLFFCFSFSACVCVYIICVCVCAGEGEFSDAASSADVAGPAGGGQQQRGGGSR